MSSTRSSRSSITVDVYVAPLLPETTESDEPLTQWWSPHIATLIHTSDSAIIVDTFASTDQTEDFADWVEDTIPGKQVKYFFTTHARLDHYLGFQVLQKRFPGLQAIATSKVLESIWPTQLPAKVDWSGFFCGQVDASKHGWKALPASNELELDGYSFQAYDADQGDSLAKSFLHVPSLDMVVGGDLVYGDCHQYLAECNNRIKRAEWVKAIEQIESLKPKIVVPGYKRPSQIDGAYLTESTKEYIVIFGSELDKAESAQDLERRMIELYPERWNHRVLEISCQNSFASKILPVESLPKRT